VQDNLSALGMPIEWCPIKNLDHLRGVAIFAEAFMGIPAQQAAKITRPLMPSAAPAVLLHSLHTQRIRIDCGSLCSHNLSLFVRKRVATSVTGKNRPSGDRHDWQLYGKQFCDMEFICVPIAVIERLVIFRGCLAVNAFKRFSVTL